MSSQQCEMLKVCSENFLQGISNSSWTIPPGEPQDPRSHNVIISLFPFRICFCDEDAMLNHAIDYLSLPGSRLQRKTRVNAWRCVTLQRLWRMQKCATERLPHSVALSSHVKTIVLVGSTFSAMEAVVVNPPMERWGSVETLVFLKIFRWLVVGLFKIEKIHGFRLVSLLNFKKNVRLGLL